jgi:FkbM family methyltransferase
MVCGVELAFHTDDDSSYQWFYPRYDAGRIHEAPVAALLLEALKGRSCFVDVGAHLGWYACLAGRYLPNGSIYAFEMDATAYGLLQRNLSLNACHNVRTFQVAVSDAAGRASYRKLKAGPSPGLQLIADPLQSPEGNEADVVEVEAIALDDFFAREGIAPDVIKVDVEGGEFKVLRGMMATLAKRGPVLFVEVHPKQLESFHSSVIEVVSILKQAGYAVFEIEGLRKNSASAGLRDWDPTRDVARNTMLFARRGT